MLIIQQKIILESKWNVKNAKLSAKFISFNVSFSKQVLKRCVMVMSSSKLSRQLANNKEFKKYVEATVLLEYKNFNLFWLFNRKNPAFFA